MKGTIGEEAEGTQGLMYDEGDHIIQVNNVTIIKLLTGTILKAKGDAINNYTRPHKA